jgi:hypothetical protein
MSNLKSQQSTRNKTRLDIPHIYCTDHVLQLMAKNAYLDSWYNGAAVGVANYADDLDLDEVMELSTMAKARSGMV